MFPLVHDREHRCRVITCYCSPVCVFVVVFVVVFLCACVVVSKLFKRKRERKKDSNLFHFGMTVCEIGTVTRDAVEVEED